MTRDQLDGYLTGAGFKSCKIAGRHHVHHHSAHRKNRCVFEFCAKKPA
ncbi:hypothetical protein [Methanoregula sp.]